MAATWKKRAPSGAASWTACTGVDDAEERMAEVPAAAAPRAVAGWPSGWKSEAIPNGATTMGIASGAPRNGVDRSGGPLPSARGGGTASGRRPWVAVERPPVARAALEVVPDVVGQQGPGRPGISPRVTNCSPDDQMVGRAPPGSASTASTSGGTSSGGGTGAAGLRAWSGGDLGVPHRATTRGEVVDRGLVGQGVAANVILAPHPAEWKD